MSWRRLSEFQVQLAICEALTRVELARPWHDLEVAGTEFPLRRAAVFLSPRGKIPAIEKHHGVRGRPAGCLGRARGAGIDHCGLRPVTVVLRVAGIDVGLREHARGPGERDQPQTADAAPACARPLAAQV